jgi:ketosteroid isomerase-like protein
VSEHPNAERLRAGFAAFPARDPAALRGLFAADVSWTIPGRSPLAGTYRGLDEILGMLARAVELTGGTYRAEPGFVLADGDHVAALYRAGGRRGDRELDIDQLLLCRMSDDRIAEVRALPTDQSAFDDFWS